MADSATNSTAHLRGVAGIRKRPAMYIGGTDRCGMTYVVGEPINNSVDQFLMGHATRVTIEIESDGRTVTVVDDGVGMPFDVSSPDEEASLATQYLTAIHTTPTADSHVPHVHFLHSGSGRGVGVVALNAVSEHLFCSSWRKGRLWTQEFRRGVAVSEPEITDHGDGRGTTLRFTLDREIFNDATIDRRALRDSIVDKVSLFDGLCIELNGERLFAEKGLATRAESICAELQHQTATWGNRPAFHMNEVYDDMIIHAAAYEVADETNWTAWANCLLMPQGGTHQTAFSNAMAEFSWTPAVGLIHVMMKDPEFTGGTIARLNVPKFQESIESRIREQLLVYCAEHHVTKAKRCQKPDSSTTKGHALKTDGVICQ